MWPCGYVAALAVFLKRTAVKALVQILEVSVFWELIASKSTSQKNSTRHLLVAGGGHTTGGAQGDAHQVVLPWSCPAGADKRKKWGVLVQSEETYDRSILFFEQQEEIEGDAVHQQ